MSAARPSIWIISPAADLGLLVLTPLAIIPLVSGLAAGAMTPEAIALAVFAFASLGHHLPGLMRAYGDRELFAQYRWRFLLAPPLAIGMCWLSFITLELHGLELLLLLWATWHILMQTYGFMRIYDMKQGHAARWHANWDFAACVTVFAAGFVFSDIRMFGFADTLSLAGMPLFTPAMLAAARWVVGLAAVVILLGYLVVAIGSVGRLAKISWLKILLLACTALLYWWSGNLSVNLLIGVAMFDIFHAIQYDAIVWYYNRRRAEKAGADAGPLAWLFHRRWWALPVYVAAILAFGGLGFFTSSSDPTLVPKIAMTLFAASAMLHFYYDGFIWKVSQPKTSENLSIESAAATVTMPTGWKHAIGWTAFIAVLIALGWLETRGTPSAVASERLASLAKLTPEVPELQLRLAEQALAEGKTRHAFDAAKAAAARRPRSFAAQVTWGDAALAAGKYAIAEEAYERAKGIRPEDTSTDRQLAMVYFRHGEAAVQAADFKLAEKKLKRSLQLEPKHAEANYQLGNVYFLTGRMAEAATHYQLCVDANAEFTDAYNNLGAALYQTEQFEAAEAAYRKSIELQPRFAPAHYNLGLVLIARGETTEARRSVYKAASLGQRPSPEVLRAVRP